MNIKMQLYSIFAILAVVATQTAEAKFLSQRPEFLTPCHLQDPNFNGCFASNFQVLFHEWRDGVPGLKSVGKLDPLYVKRVLIAQDPKNPVALNADLHNVVIRGAGDVVIKEASFNIKNLVLKCKMFVPKLRFNSDYKLTGRILNLALNGNGKAFFEVENTEMSFIIHTKLRDDHGYTFTDIERLSLDIKSIGGFRVRLDNLFNGQKVLEESTNAVFNENWRDFYEILRPPITQSVEAIIGDRLKKIYSYVPANFFIADIPSAAQLYG